MYNAKFTVSNVDCNSPSRLSQLSPSAEFEQSEIHVNSIVQCVVCTVYCAVYNMHCPLYTVQCIPCVQYMGKPVAMDLCRHTSNTL